MATYEKNARLDRILDALGPELHADDPNIDFIPASSLSVIAQIPQRTVTRLLNELLKDGDVECCADFEGGRAVLWCRAPRPVAASQT